MSLVRAVKKELRRSFDFRGRTARAPYLLFLSSSTLLFAGVLAAGLTVTPTNIGTWVFFVTAVFYIPVTSAGVRRLHDTGQTGLLMLDPLKPIVALSVLFLLIYLAVAGTVAGMFALTITSMMFPAVILFVFAAALLGACFMTLAYFSNTMGQLLLPSEPGPNKYGPNPNEVHT